MELPEWLQDRVNNYRSIAQQAGISDAVASRDGGMRQPNAHRIRSTHQTRAVKVDAATRSIIGIAYPAWDPPAPDQGKVTQDEVQRFVDSWGTFMRPATVRSLANRFMANGRSMDTDHGRVAGAASVGESFIVREGDPQFPAYAGSWAVAPVITRDDVWARVEAAQQGDSKGLNGFSIDVVTQFRAVSVDIEDIGIVTFGEFIDPEPLFLSLVPAPATRQKFQPGQRQAPQDSIRLVQCGAVDESHNRGDQRMSDKNTTTVNEVTPEEMGIVARIFRAFRDDPAKINRAIAVQRAVASLVEKAEQVDLKNMAYGLADMLWSYIYDVLSDSEMDFEAKREALIQGFADLAKIAKERLSKDVVTEAVRTQGGDDLGAVVGRLQASIQRAGKKISKERMDKLTQAAGLIQSVLDGATDADSDSQGEEGQTDQSAQRKAKPVPVPSATSTTEAEREAPPSTTTIEENDVNTTEITKAIRDLATQVETIAADVTSIKAERAAAENATAPTTTTTAPTETDATNELRSALQQLTDKVGGISAEIKQLRGVASQRRGGGDGDTTEGPVSDTGAGRVIVTRANGAKVDMTGIV